MGTMHAKMAQMRRTAHVRPICFSVKEEAACEQLPCVMKLKRKAVTEKMKSTAVSWLLTYHFYHLYCALFPIASREKLKSKSITNKHQQQLIIS